MKRVFIVILVSFLISFPVHAFEDTDSNAVSRMIEKGVLEEKDHFFPDLKCTRAQFTVWAIRNIGENPDSKKIQEPFLDVSPEQDFSPFIARAWELGAIPSEKIFSPKKPITKLDALKIALKLEKVSIPLSVGDLNFIDIPKDTEGKGIVSSALQMRITQEIKENVFGSYKTINRLECIKILDTLSLRRKSEPGDGKSADAKNEEKPKQEIFDQIWKVIHTKYLRADDVDSENLMETIIRKTIDSLGDQHTTYFNEQEVKDFLTGVGVGSQFGIGAQVGLDKEGLVQIIKPLKNSPSEQAGVRPGDIILKVDGVDVSGGDKSLEEVVSMIKGEDKEIVHIIFLRRGKNIDIAITRGPIEIQAVTPHIVNGYLVLEIDFFGEETVNDFLKIVEENPLSAKKGIILDLRNNPGGFLDSAIDMLSHFLPSGSIAVKTRGRDILHTETLHGPGDIAQYPLVILVNERSASASEIVAGAVQDYGRGVVAGGKTYGKGTAQELLQFQDGSALKITIAEWLTPKDRSIDGVGITPDFLFEDVDNSDAVYEYATRLIKRGQWKSSSQK